MARRTITARMVLRMHQLFRCGNTLQEIADVLGCERRTVSRYVNQEVNVSPDLQRLIDSIQWYADPKRPVRKDAPAGYLTMRDAAKLMPTHPSPQFMRDLINAEKLKGTRIDGMLLTKQSWVDRYIKARYGRLPAVLAIAMPMLPLVISPSPHLMQCKAWFIGKCFQIGRMPCVPVQEVATVATAKNCRATFQPIPAERCRVLWRSAEIERLQAGMIN